MSSTSTDAGIPITYPQLAEYAERANTYVRKISWNPGNSSSRDQKGTLRDIYSNVSTTAQNLQEVSVIDIAQKLSGIDSIVLSEEVNYSLLVLRKGLQIGLHVKDLYTQYSGLTALIQQQQNKVKFTPEQSTEFQQKQQTCSIIMMFCTASYTVWELSRYKTEEIGKSLASIDMIPEFAFGDALRATRCMLYYYGGALTSGVVQSSYDFTKMTLVYFSHVLDEMRSCSGSLQYSEPFTRNHYKLEKSDFAIRGFEVESGATVSTIEFRRVEDGDIVGNRDSKHYARRIVMALLVYDVAAKMNAMVELGAFTSVNLGYGKPGTGKTMINGRIATEIYDRAKWLGIPFVYRPLPDTIVSTFQGGSAERFMEWFRPLNDTSKLFYAPIDDAENALESRTRQGVSAGVREVIGAFLRNTEGAYAIIRGNWIIDLFTNIPDQLDGAVLSRVLRRFQINGAEDVADFLDQDWLWWSKHAKLDPTFVDMVDPNGYIWMATQKQLATLSDVYADIGEPKEARVQAVYHRICREHSPHEHMFYGKLFRGIFEEYPLFSSRDVRNIQRAIDARIMDFDFPEEWMDDPEVFFRKDYKTKLGMLIAMKKTNMKGLSFAEIRRQETVVYLDNMARIADGEKERRLGAMVDDIVLRYESQERAQPILQKRGLASV